MIYSRKKIPLHNRHGDFCGSTSSVRLRNYDVDDDRFGLETSAKSKTIFVKSLLRHTRSLSKFNDIVIEEKDKYTFSVRHRKLNSSHGIRLMAKVTVNIQLRRGLLDKDQFV